MTGPATAAPGSTAPAASSAQLIRLVIAGSGAWLVAYLSYYAQAQMLPELMDKFAQGEAAVGSLSSLENAAFFITMMAAAGPVARLSRAGTAVVGGLVLVLANVASGYVIAWDSLLVLRMLAGVGAGLISACGTAALGSAIEPDRAFAIVTVTSGLLYPLEPLVLPYAVAPYGVTGGYLFLAALSLAFIPAFLWLLPPRQIEGETTPVIALLMSAPNRMLAILAMVALFSFETGQAAVYQFVAQLGEVAGLTKHAVGEAMSATSLLGLSGGVFAAVLGTRFGRMGPIMIGLFLNAAAAAGLALQSDAVSYWLMNLLWGMAYSFVVPYLMGALAELDDRGRWVVAADGAWNGGTALGPVLAGLTVEAAGYHPLAALAMVAGFVCMGLMAVVVRRLAALQSGLADPARTAAAIAPG